MTSFALPRNNPAQRALEEHARRVLDALKAQAEPSAQLPQRFLEGLLRGSPLQLTDSDDLALWRAQELRAQGKEVVLVLRGSGLQTRVEAYSAASCIKPVGGPDAPGGGGSGESPSRT